MPRLLERWPDDDPRPEGFDGTAGPREPAEGEPRVAMQVGMTNEGSELPAKLQGWGGRGRGERGRYEAGWGSHPRRREDGGGGGKGTMCSPHLCVACAIVEDDGSEARHGGLARGVGWVEGGRAEGGASCDRGGRGGSVGKGARCGTECDRVLTV